MIAVASRWFLLRASRPELDGKSLIVSVITSPILLILGISGNVRTCGLAIPAVAL